MGGLCWTVEEGVELCSCYMETGSMASNVFLS